MTKSTGEVSCDTFRLRRASKRHAKSDQRYRSQEGSFQKALIKGRMKVQLRFWHGGKHRRFIRLFRKKLQFFFCR